MKKYPGIDPDKLDLARLPGETRASRFARVMGQKLLARGAAEDVRLGVCGWRAMDAIVRCGSRGEIGHGRRRQRPHRRRTGRSHSHDCTGQPVERTRRGCQRSAISVQREAAADTGGARARWVGQPGGDELAALQGQRTVRLNADVLNTCQRPELKLVPAPRNAGALVVRCTGAHLADVLR